MVIPYTKKYLKIYFWQGLSIALNFLSMLVVIPKLSEAPAIYGIYTLCMGIGIFLSYADIGFVSAGAKYASESFAKKDLNHEIEILGFLVFILFVLSVVYMAVVLGIAAHPQILIKNLQRAEEIRVASMLLCILAISSPFIILQRILQISFGIRLEDYILHRLVIISNVIKILSVFYFFDSRYNIIGYYLFCQCLIIFSSLIALWIAEKRYRYSYSLLFKAIKFSRKIYDKTKHLAFSSTFTTLGWILYYELDSIGIAKTLGQEDLAFYAVGLTLSSFLRTLFSVPYVPLTARFNHFIGINDVHGLRSLFQRIITVMIPMSVFPVLSLFILMRPVIFCWVGESYSSSVGLAQFLVCTYAFSFIINPTGIILTAQERIRTLYFSSALLPLVYWLGVALTISTLGVTSFALFKLIVSVLFALMSLGFALEILKLRLTDFLKKNIVPLVLPCTFILLFLNYAATYMPLTKGKLNLLEVVVTGGFSSLVATYIYYLLCSPFKECIRSFLNSVRGQANLVCARKVEDEKPFLSRESL